MLSKPVIGLEDVAVKYTRISYIDSEKGELYYRGYNVIDLFNYSTFEETAYLLIMGKLPTKRELEDFKTEIINARKQGVELCSDIANSFQLSKLDIVKFCLILAANKYDLWPRLSGKYVKVDELERKASLILGLVQSFTAIASMKKNLQLMSKVIDEATPNFLYTVLTGTYDEEKAWALDRILIIYADHEIPASTFTGMVIASTLSHLLYAIEASISALQGPLHGGALVNVAKILQSLKLGEAEQYVRQVLDRRERLMGFGHRVYKTYDPRAKLLKRLAAKLALDDDKAREVYMKALELEKAALKHLSMKRIYPNVDFWAAAAMLALGIEASDQLLVFTAARCSGWLAHIIEYLQQNRIIRPRAIYIGEKGLMYIPLHQRG